MNRRHDSGRVGPMLIVSSLCTVLVGSIFVDAARAQARLPPLPTIAMLFRAACLGSAGQPDLVIRVETDWLGAEALATSRGPWGPLWGAPLSAHVARRGDHAHGSGVRVIQAEVDVWLDTDGRLIDFKLRGDGPLVNEPDLGQLEQAILATPGRSDASALEALIRAGALYPPNQPEKVQRRAVGFLAQLTPILGAARIEDVSFAGIPPPEPVGDTPWENKSVGSDGAVAVRLYWTVKARTSDSKLIFLIDPLRGNVVSLQAHRGH